MLPNEINESILKGRTLQQWEEDFSQQLSWLPDYSKVKHRLYFHLVNQTRNASFLKHLIHYDWLDLSLIFKICIRQELEQPAGIFITKPMLDYYQVSTEEILHHALMHAPKVRPVKIEEMKETLQRLGVYQNRFTSSPTMHVITNEEGTFGAGALLYPGVKERIAQMYQGDYYVLPSSIHEVLTVPYSSNRNLLPSLKETVASINQKVVEDREFLSNQVYRYHSSTNTISIAKDFFNLN